jgi:hypothetical protein
MKLFIMYKLRSYNLLTLIFVGVKNQNFIIAQ